MQIEIFQQVIKMTASNEFYYFLHYLDINYPFFYLHSFMFFMMVIFYTVLIYHYY